MRHGASDEATEVNGTQGKKLAAYVEGFFPKGYSVDVSVCYRHYGEFPLVTIVVTPPFFERAVSHDAYLHEVLDINYMGDAAAYLLKFMRAAVVKNG